MAFERLTAVATRHRREMILLALLTTFAGAALLIDRPKGSVLEWFALPLLLAGGGIFVWAVWPSKETLAETPNYLASRLLWRLGWNGRLIPFFPVIGIALILADVVYNLTLSATPAFQTEDTIALLAAVTLAGYNFVPPSFSRERDFALLFFICVNAILVVPLLVARAYYADFDRSVDIYSWVALAPQTSAVLSVLGVANSVHAVQGSTAPGLTFSPQHVAGQVTLVITTSCSGIYSFGIFASAFVAFVLTEHEKASRQVWMLLAVGIATAYVANVLRMVVIVLVGYYTDSVETDLQNMLIAHSYAGWLIFLGWITLFWGVVLKVLPVHQPDFREAQRPFHGDRRTNCALCGDQLTVAIPALRCSCGNYYHEACIRRASGCPSCGKVPEDKIRATTGGS
jgi:archaeosortase C (PEF-CTERM variant)